MRLRKRTLLAAATACAALAIPSVASAKDFCVDGPAGCTGTPVPAPLLSFALSQAQSNASDDRFFLAPGTYDSDPLTHHSGEQVQIIGAGAGKTILRGNANGPVLELGGNPDSSVAALTLEPTGAASSGLKLIGTRAHDFAVNANAASSLVTGVELFGESALDDGSVDVGSLAGHAITVYSGAATVTDSTVTAPEGAGLGTGASEATVRRSTLNAKIGAIALAGHLTVSDSVIDLRGKASGGGAVGVYAFRTGNGPTTATADGNRLTIIGSTPSSMETIGVGAYADGAGMSAGVRLRDSVINGIGVPMARTADNGATASITTDHSAYPNSVTPPSIYDVGPGSISSTTA